MAAHESYGHILHGNLMGLLRIRLIETGISIYFVKIIDVQIITRTLILYSVVFPENFPDLLLYRRIIRILYDQSIDTQSLLI